MSHKIPLFILVFVPILLYHQYGGSSVKTATAPKTVVSDSDGKKADSITRARARMNVPQTWSRRQLDSMMRPVNFYVVELDTTGEAPWVHVDWRYIDSLYKAGLWRSRDTAWVLLGADSCTVISASLGRTPDVPDTIKVKVKCIDRSNCLALRPFVFGYDSTADSIVDGEIVGKKKIFIPIKDSTWLVDTCDPCNGIRLITHGHTVGSLVEDTTKPFCEMDYDSLDFVSWVLLPPNLVATWGSPGVKYYDRNALGVFLPTLRTLAFGKTTTDSVVLSSVSTGNWLSSIPELTTTPNPTQMQRLVGVSVIDSLSTKFIKLRIGEVVSDSGRATPLYMGGKSTKGSCCYDSVAYTIKYYNPYRGDSNDVTYWHKVRLPRIQEDSCPTRHKLETTVGYTWVYDSTTVVVVDTCKEEASAQYIYNKYITEVYNTINNNIKNVYKTINKYYDSCGCKPDTVCLDSIDVELFCVDTIKSTTRSTIQRTVCDTNCYELQNTYVDSTYLVLTDAEYWQILAMNNGLGLGFSSDQNTICLRRVIENDTIRWVLNYRELTDPNYPHKTLPYGEPETDLIKCLPKTWVNNFIWLVDGLRERVVYPGFQVRRQMVPCANTWGKDPLLFEKKAVPGTCTTASTNESTTITTTGSSPLGVARMTIDTCNECLAVQQRHYGVWYRDTTIKPIWEYTAGTDTCDTITAPKDSVLYQPKRIVQTTKVIGKKVSSKINSYLISGGIDGLKGTQIEALTPSPAPCTIIRKIINPISSTTYWYVFGDEFATDTATCSHRRDLYELECRCVDRDQLKAIMGADTVHLDSASITVCWWELQNDGPPILVPNCLKDTTVTGVCYDEGLGGQYSTLTWQVPDKDDPCTTTTLNCGYVATDSALVRVDTTIREVFLCDSVVPFIVDTCRPCEPKVVASGDTISLCDPIELVNLCPDGEQPRIEGRKIIFNYGPCGSGGTVTINGETGNEFTGIATAATVAMATEQKIDYDEVADSLQQIRDTLVLGLIRPSERDRYAVDSTKLAAGANIELTGDPITGYTIAATMPSISGDGGIVSLQGIYASQITLKDTLGRFQFTGVTYDSSIQISLKADTAMAYTRDTSSGKFWNLRDYWPLATDTSKVKGIVDLARAYLDTSGNGAWYYKLPKVTFDMMAGVRDTSRLWRTYMVGSGAIKLDSTGANYTIAIKPDSVLAYVRDTSAGAFWNWSQAGIVITDTAKIQGILGFDTTKIQGLPEDDPFAVRKADSASYALGYITFKRLSDTLNANPRTGPDTSGYGDWYYKLPKTDFDNMNGTRDSSRNWRSYVTGVSPVSVDSSGGLYKIQVNTSDLSTTVDSLISEYNTNDSSCYEAYTVPLGHWASQMKLRTEPYTKTECDTLWSYPLPTARDTSFARLPWNIITYIQQEMFNTYGVYRDTVTVGGPRATISLVLDPITGDYIGNMKERSASYAYRIGNSGDTLGKDWLSCPITTACGGRFASSDTVVLTAALIINRLMDPSMSSYWQRYSFTDTSRMIVNPAKYRGDPLLQYAGVENCGEVPATSRWYAPEDVWVSAGRDTTIMVNKCLYPCPSLSVSAITTRSDTTCYWDTSYTEIPIVQSDTIMHFNCITTYFLPGAFEVTPKTRAFNTVSQSKFDSLVAIYGCDNKVDGRPITDSVRVTIYNWNGTTKLRTTTRIETQKTYFCGVLQNDPMSKYPSGWHRTDSFFNVKNSTWEVIEIKTCWLPYAELIDPNIPCGEFLQIVPRSDSYYMVTGSCCSHDTTLVFTAPSISNPNQVITNTFTYSIPDGPYCDYQEIRNTIIGYAPDTVAYVCDVTTEQLDTPEYIVTITDTCNCDPSEAVFEAVNGTSKMCGGIRFISECGVRQPYFLEDNRTLVIPCQDPKIWINGEQNNYFENIATRFDLSLLWEHYKYVTDSLGQVCPPCVDLLRSKLDSLTAIVDSIKNSITGGDYCPPCISDSLKTYATLSNIQNFIEAEVDPTAVKKADSASYSLGYITFKRLSDTLNANPRVGLDTSGLGFWQWSQAGIVIADTSKIQGLPEADPLAVRKADSASYSLGYITYKRLTDTLNTIPRSPAAGTDTSGYGSWWYKLSKESFNMMMGTRDTSRTWKTIVSLTGSAVTSVDSSTSGRYRYALSDTSSSFIIGQYFALADTNKILSGKFKAAQDSILALRTKLDSIQTVLDQGKVVCDRATIGGDGLVAINWPSQPMAVMPTYIDGDPTIPLRWSWSGTQIIIKGDANWEISYCVQGTYSP